MCVSVCLRACRCLVHIAVSLSFGRIMERKREGEIRRPKNIRKFFLLFISRLIGLPVVNTLRAGGAVTLREIIDEQEVSSISPSLRSTPVAVGSYTISFSGGERGGLRSNPCIRVKFGVTPFFAGFY